MKHKVLQLMSVSEKEAEAKGQTSSVPVEERYYHLKIHLDDGKQYAFTFQGWEPYDMFSNIVLNNMRHENKWLKTNTDKMIVSIIDTTKIVSFDMMLANEKQQEVLTEFFKLDME